VISRQCFPGTQPFFFAHVASLGNTLGNQKSGEGMYRFFSTTFLLCFAFSPFVHVVLISVFVVLLWPDVCVGLLLWWSEVGNVLTYFNMSTKVALLPNKEGLTLKLHREDYP